MTSKLEVLNINDLKPRISVIGIGGAGCNAINNMIASGLDGVEFIAANTDAQALAISNTDRRIQLGAELTEGLGAGAKPEVGKEAAEEAIEEVREHIKDAHMVFLAAGMGGGTGTGAISVIARAAREMNILTVAIVSKPFQFEGSRRMRTAEAGISELHDYVDTLIVIPNQNLFRIANEKTTFAEAFLLADQVLYSGIACIVDLIIKDGLINLDFADVKAVMEGMGPAMMGTGEGTGEDRATIAAEQAISNPLLDEISLRGARGLLVSIIGDRNLTLFEVDEAATRVKQEADPDANIIVGASFEEGMEDKLRVSIVASGLDGTASGAHTTATNYRIPAAPLSMPDPIRTSARFEPVKAPVTAEKSGIDEPASEEAEKDDEPTAKVEDTFLAQMLHADRSSGEDERRHAAGVDPYMGSTSVDEFAQALSEVIGTVEDSEASDQASGDYRVPWQSSDGVVIEDGFTPPPGAMPPPLPLNDTNASEDTLTSFRPSPPADMPRRIPDISEFPSGSPRTGPVEANDSGDSATNGGMPGILRRWRDLRVRAR